MPVFHVFRISGDQILPVVSTLLDVVQFDPGGARHFHRTGRCHPGRVQPQVVFDGFDGEVVDCDRPRLAPGDTATGGQIDYKVVLGSSDY